MEQRYHQPILRPLTRLNYAPLIIPVPVASFSYSEAAFPYYTGNAPDYTSGWVNPVISQSLNGGWINDAPIITARKVAHLVSDS